MKKLYSLIFLLLFTTSVSYAQLNQLALSQAVTAHINQMGSFYKAGDYKGYLKFIHPVLLKAAGGKGKMLELLSQQSVQLNSKGVVIHSISFSPISEIVKNKTELQCTISQHTELNSAKGKVVTHTTLIAISTDNGKTWKFIDTSRMDTAMVRQLYPNLSIKITLPQKQNPTVYPI